VASKYFDKTTSHPALPIDGIADDPGANLVRWLFPGYIFMILVAFFALRAPGVMPAGNELNPDRAIFTSVNAATLTGFQLSIHPSEFYTPGKVILLILTVLGTLFTLVVGGLAAKRVLRLPWQDRRIYTAALVIEVFVLLMGAFSGGSNLIGGMTQTAAAWGNSGLYVDTPPTAANLYTHVILLPLAVLGGLGLVVVLQIFDLMVRGTPLNRHARVVLQMTAGLFLAGLVGCAALQIIDLESMGMRKTENWLGAFARLFPRIVTTSSLTSLNARTAGLAVYPVYQFPRSMAFLVILLMAIGASPSGTGGGLKTTTLYELFAGPWRVLRGKPASRTFGIAATWLGLYLGALVVVQTLLLWAEPQMPGDRLLFVTVSALSNVGLSHDVLSMTRASLLLVSAAMFFGRITPLLILWWMSDTTRDADVAVG